MPRSRLARLAWMPALALALALPGSAYDDKDKQKEKPKDPPVIRHLLITSSFADAVAGQLTIRGLNLCERSPRVYLTGKELAVLSHGSTEILAALPPGIAPGSYLLGVACGRGEKPRDVFSVTIGAVGPQGLPGPQGIQGQPGSMGLPGPEGRQGDVGPQGPMGPKGLNWRGPWDPTSDFGAADAVSYLGSAWIARRSNVGIAPVAGDDWSLLATKGDPGLQGEVGPQGPQGPEGPRGPEGAAGLRGATGAQGPSGPQGPPGEPGTGGPPEDPNPLLLDMYLRVGNLHGESQDPDHPDWSDVEGYQHAVRLLDPLDPRSPGRPLHDDLRVLKRADRSSAGLLEHAQRGLLLKDVDLEVCGRRLRTGDTDCFLSIRLTNALITSYSQTDLGENLTFSYEVIEWRYKAVDTRTGQTGPEAMVRWNVKQARAEGLGTSRAGSAVGYGGGNGKSFLEIRDVAGEADFPPVLQDVIGLSGFTRESTTVNGKLELGLSMTKGTDIATPALLTRLHQGTVFAATIRFGCRRGATGREECPQVIELKDVTVTELAYGANQVERLKWADPSQVVK